jgi:hypothetical protein
MKLIALTALILAIFGDVTPGSGHLLAIVSSVVAAFAFTGAPILSVVAVGMNSMAVTLPTPQLVIYDLLNYGSVASRMIDIDPVPWQYGVHFLIVIFGFLRYWDSNQRAYA